MSMLRDTKTSWLRTPSTMRPARIRIRAAALLSLGILAALVLLFALKRVRDRQIAISSLTAARQAVARQDWERAVFEFRRSLEKNIENTDALRGFAHSLLQTRPLDRVALGGAHDALVRVFDAGTATEADLERIRELRLTLELNDDIIVQCRRAVTQNPGDLTALVWLARAQAAAGYQPRARETLQPLLDHFGTERDLAASQRTEFARAFELNAQLLVTSATAENVREAIRQLDRASAILPDCGEVALTRAKIRRAHAGTLDNPATADRELAKLDLEQAEAGTFADPLAIIELAAEWLENGEPEKARAALHRADETPAELIAMRGFDADDWRVARYLCDAELGLRTGEAARVCGATHEILNDIKTKQQRLRVLPTAARVYLALNMADAFRPVVAEFSALQAALRPDRQDLAAFLEAQLALIDDRPEVAVRLLEPVVSHDADHIDAWRLLAAAYDKLDNPAAAARALSRILAKQPLDVEAGRRLVRAHVRRGDWQNAIDAAKVLESLRPAQSDLQVLRMSAELAEAIERGGHLDHDWIEKQRLDLNRLLEKAPRKSELLILSAQLAALSGALDEAERVFLQAEAVGDDPVDARLARTSFLIANCRFSEAIEVAKANTTAAPRTMATWHSLCDACLAAGETERAIWSLDEGEEQAGSLREKAVLSLRAAQLELSAERREQAIARLTAQAARDASDTRSRSLLLTIPEVYRVRATADRYLSELCALNGADSPLGKMHRAALLLNADGWQQRQSEIERLLRDSIAGNPDWTAPVLLLGQLQERLNLTSAAEETYRAALSRNPGAADVADRMLWLLDATQRLSEAPAILSRLALRPRAAHAFRMAAAFAAGAFDRAIEEAQMRVAADPRDVQGRILLARLLYLGRRDADAAIAQLDSADQLSPGSLSTRFLRVSILRGEKRDDEALQFLNAEIAKRGTPEAWLLRAQFQAFTGDLAAAERDYRKLTEILPDGGGYELLGAFLLDQRRRIEALAVWEEGKSKFPDSRPLKRRLMKELLLGDAQQRDAGLRYLAELEALTPRDPDLLRVRAFTLRTMGGAEAAQKAAALLEKAIALEPAAADAHRALISVALESGDFTYARTLALRAIGSVPDDPTLAAYRAMAELALGNSGLARELAIGILRRDARNLDAAIALLQASLIIRDPQARIEAERLTQLAREHHLGNETLTLATARVYRALGKNGDAINLLTDFLAEPRAGSGARIELIQALMSERRYVEAECEWERATPGDGRLAGVRALLDAAQGRPDTAISRLMRMATDRPEFRTTQLTTGALLCNAERAADRELGLCLLLDAAGADDDLDALARLADGLVRSGLTETAESVYRELLAADPRNARALNDVAWLRAQQGDFAVALEFADRGLRVDPSDDTLLDTRGSILAEVPQRLRDARVDFQRASVLRRFRPEAQARTLMRLGEICLRLEDAAGARHALDEIRRLQENHRVLSDKQLEELDALGAKLGRLSADSRAVATWETGK